ncbi:intein-containing Rv2578c family radical SAM protein [Phytohabitans flavus]|uniref:Radical SAM protein n=1 Tax=Phytohabitans flavus TaxID=1076124 RepID=A0A6F8Y1Z9_9ACTN|nr:intein-containing Rv2578c family radical SAM protein [Phytohabitans flavus]BCB80090.1 radical SAM protein [Phytohabitans flavus]
MRWDNLSAPPDGEVPDGPAPAAPPLPLALPGAVARTFDTPGFAGMTFYEVQAKSIINRVPASSRMSFMWTVNPYRGCSHACSYCLAGDTPILMADGSTRALRDLKVGDAIYGTVPVGTSRRYTVTTVLAHWSTTKPAYRVTLADGTQLIASGDHRFLSERGWRQVAEGPRGPGLAAGDQFMGTGQFAEGPKDSADYRRGYLSGMIRGDAHLATYAPEAVDRSLDYLAGFGAATIDAIRDLIRWPDRVSDDWCKGFLAGVFDSDGSRDGRDLWIRSNDTEILDQIAAALRRFGFDAWLESSHAAVRLRGGLTEHMRFYHLADPAISRKRSISGRTVGSDARLRVVSIEPLGVDLPLYDITTGTADFIANGVVSHNCFARGTHTYLDLDAGHDFDTKVVVKVNAGELVRRELAAPKWRGEHIAMGTNVDPYQRAEGRYRLMPRILSALRDFANPFSILTKGTLILRDLPLLRQAAEVTQVGVAMSVGFVDERMWRSVESGTPSPRRRLDAVRALTDAGFRVSVLMAPILPGLTDTEESIEATVTAIAASGAASVTPIPLHLRPGAREWYASWLTREFPALAPHYRRLYGRGSYLPKEYQREVTARVRMAARRHGLDRTEPGEARQTEPPPQPPEPEQLTLL